MRLTSQQVALYQDELLNALKKPDVENTNRILNELFETEDIHAFLLTPITKSTSSDNSTTKFIYEINKFYETHHPSQQVIFLSKLKKAGFVRSEVTIKITEIFIKAGFNYVPDQFLKIIEDDIIFDYQQIYNLILVKFNDIEQSPAFKWIFFALSKKEVDFNIGFNDFISKQPHNNWVHVFIFHIAIILGKLSILTALKNKSTYSIKFMPEVILDIVNIGRLNRGEISNVSMRLKQLKNCPLLTGITENDIDFIIQQFQEREPTYTYQFESPSIVKQYICKQELKPDANPSSLITLTRAFYIEAGISDFMVSRFFHENNALLTTENTDASVKSLRLFANIKYRADAYACIQKIHDDEESLSTLCAIITHKDLPNDIKNTLMYILDRLFSHDYLDCRPKVESVEAEQHKSDLSGQSNLKLFGSATIPTITSPKTSNLSRN